MSEKIQINGLKKTIFDFHIYLISLGATQLSIESASLIVVSLLRFIWIALKTDQLLNQHMMKKKLIWRL